MSRKSAAKRQHVTPGELVPGFSKTVRVTPRGAALLQVIVDRLHERSGWSRSEIEAELRGRFRITESPAGPVINGACLGGGH